MGGPIETKIESLEGQEGKKCSLTSEKNDPITSEDKEESDRTFGWSRFFIFIFPLTW